MRHAARANTGRYVSRLTSGTLAVIMAGGRGERLKTADPASLQAGDTLRRQVQDHRFRAVELRQFRHPPDRGPDQYKAQSLIQHIQRAGATFAASSRVCGTDTGAAADRLALVSRTADSVYQNLDFIRSHHPTHVLILAGTTSIRWTTAR